MNFKTLIADAIQALPVAKSAEKTLKNIRILVMALVALIVVQVITSIIMSTYYMTLLIQGR